MSGGGAGAAAGRGVQAAPGDAAPGTALVPGLLHRDAPRHRRDELRPRLGRPRFAPLAQANGTPVHTYYLASTPEAAYLESVLHDVPLAPPD